MAANQEIANYKEGPSFISGAAFAQWSVVKMSTTTIVKTAATSDVAFSVATRAASAAGIYVPVAKVGSFIWVRSDGNTTVGAFVIPSGTTAGNVIVLGAVTGTVCYVGQMITATATTELGILLLVPHSFAA